MQIKMKLKWNSLGKKTSIESLKNTMNHTEDRTMGFEDDETKELDQLHKMIMVNTHYWRTLGYC